VTVLFNGKEWNKDYNSISSVGLSLKVTEVSFSLNADYKEIVQTDI